MNQANLEDLMVDYWKLGTQMKKIIMRKDVFASYIASFHPKEKVGESKPGLITAGWFSAGSCQIEEGLEDQISEYLIIT